MGSRSVITLTTGRSGSGKSFVRCAAQFVDELLPETETVVWTNFPIGVVPDDHDYPPRYEGERFVDRMAEAVAEKTGATVTEYLERLNIIPKAECERWRTGESGPWDFFKDKDIGNCHIAIDEVHVFCGSDSKPATKHAWKNWLGEIRHRGASVELISQHRDKIAKELIKEAGVQLSLVKIDDLRDPICGIQMGDWYELRAKFFTGQYTSTVVEIERMDQDGKPVEVNRRQFKLVGDYFRFYDSFSAPESGTGAGAKRPRKEFERRGRCNLLLWFFVRNSPQLSWRIGLVSFLMWVALGGGAAWGAEKFDDAVNWVAHRQKRMAAERKGETYKPEAAPGAAPGGTVPEGKMLVTPEQQKLLADLDRREQALAARVAEFEASEAELSELVLVTQTEIVMRSGEAYAPGDAIESGKHKGARVAAIDYRRRVVRLSDGEILRMGGGVGVLSDGVPNLPGSETTAHVGGPQAPRYPAGSVRPSVGGAEQTGTAVQR